MSCVYFVLAMRCFGDKVGRELGNFYIKWDYCIYRPGNYWNDADDDDDNDNDDDDDDVSMILMYILHFPISVSACGNDDYDVDHDEDDDGGDYDDVNDDDDDGDDYDDDNDDDEEESCVSNSWNGVNDDDDSGGSDDGWLCFIVNFIRVRRPISVTGHIDSLSVPGMMAIMITMKETMFMIHIALNIR